MIIHKIGTVTVKTFNKNVDYYLDFYNNMAESRKQKLFIIKEKNKIIFYGETNYEEI